MKKYTLFFLIFALFSTISLSGCGKQPVVKDVSENEQDPTTPQVVEPVTQKPTESPDLSTTTQSWYFVRNQEHRVPRINDQLGFNMADYDAWYVGSNKKVIFLTFDEGYENGYTNEILDILKLNQVSAAFFVTEPYITSNPGLVKRMIAEGHIVGNHSKTHPSMPSLTENPDKFNQEITDTANTFKEITGKEMPKFIRPPRGEYSEKSLYMTTKLGYKTIFWSFAYQDWLTDQQPEPEASFNKIIEGTHNGAIILLHAVSSTNTQILDRVIKDIRKEGYRFAPLTELE